MADDLHIRLDRPKGLRRELLGSALQASEFLHVLERVHHWEEERLLVKQEFATLMRGLTTELDLFQKGIPPLPLEFLRKQQQSLQRATQQPLRTITPREELLRRSEQHQAIPPSFLSPLEEEMAELKRKIKSLEI